MNAPADDSPALLEARKAESRVAHCLQDSRSFLLEAGAGAGKTYSLIEALRRLIASEGPRLRRNHQRIACITFTNAATAVINSRIDSDPLVFTGTIHAFCWSLIKGFQPTLRELVATIPEWAEKVAEAGGISGQTVEYELGHRRITPERITLHHDDVLGFMVTLLSRTKFQGLLAQGYPFILIDEYQDTNLQVMAAIKEHLLGRSAGPLVGLFGDHWQRIYDKTCGHVAHDALTAIGKQANFRSATRIVTVLNKMRPELPQAVRDAHSTGSATVFHTNAWQGERRSGAGGGHWKGDVPADVAHNYLRLLLEHLKEDGWDFAPDRTKVLMLTHNVLAAEQGYESISRLFTYADQYIKREDALMAFFVDVLEPTCTAFQARRFGEMRNLLGDEGASISSHSEKVAWVTAMDGLMKLRVEGSVGQVLDYLECGGRPRLPEAILRSGREEREWQGGGGQETPGSVQLLRSMREVPYREVIALTRFIEGHTPFATKHSVKGDEYENVVVVLGRGWNRYNFGQFLEWTATGVPAGKQETYDRNRNLFYVCCSRPTTRLALLFTQELSATSMTLLKEWFGRDEVRDLHA